jgi:hypothetical protein
MINMFMWINNPNETSVHFHMRALHPHSIDVMRYFAGEVKKVHAFFKRGHQRQGWSNVHVNMLFESGVIGHLMGSYDGGGPGHQWGLERCEIVGHEARIVITDACEVLEFQPRGKIESETYKYLGNMRSFGDTFDSRICRDTDTPYTATAGDNFGNSFATNSDSDNNGLNDTWSPGAPSTYDWSRVMAIRVALVVRSAQFEKTNVSPATFTLWPDATANSGCNNTAALTGAPNAGPVWTVPDQQYRYRIFETIIPLRNSIWMPG